jgi:membrane-associated phospholipid phosphatase
MRHLRVMFFRPRLPGPPLLLAITALVALPSSANADPQVAALQPADPAAPTPQAAAPPAPPPTFPSLQTLELGQHFTIDPVADGVLTATGLGFAGLLGLVLSTGEIKPVTPPTDTSILLPIDRGAVSQTFDPNADTLSNIGLWTGVGFTALDSVLSCFRDGWDAGLVDAIMYAESLSITLTVTDITKIAVRRPRPFDYKNPNASSTDSELSFFSGHASTLGAVTGTATYLAFVRSPHTARPWLTLIGGTALTAFVSYERVRSGEHFPTDVIAGALAGAAIGVLVPHLHRHKEEAPPVWIGAAPAPKGEGGTISLQGIF